MFKLDQSKTISEREDKITLMWKKGKFFEKSQDRRPESKRYSFLDGPPFVTGLPHYASLLPRMAKDIIPRFKTMKGYKVRHVWGWDCHGLPIEERVEKKIGLKNRRDIVKYGINNFLKACKDYVDEVSSEWEWYVDKIAEWVDFKGAYKTMDTSYMESVIWIFKTLYDKGLVYEGVKTLLYCTRCGTPVSRFEIAMDNSYADMEDPAITVEFPVTTKGRFEGSRILAWTTTPWTMPSNRALVVDPNEIYVKAKTKDLSVELELAWLVKKLPKDISNVKSVNITQAYLDESDENLKDVRIRKQGDEYTLTRKFFAKDKTETGQNFEFTEKISKERYEELIKNAQKKIVKTRYFYPLKNGLTAEIDVYQNNLKGLIVAEVEFEDVESLKKFEKPDWFDKEVTDSKGIYPKEIANLSIEEVNKINSNFVQKPHDFNKQVEEKIVILAKKRVKEVFRKRKYEIVEEFKGSELIGLSYKAPYDFFKPNKNDFKVYSYKEMVSMDEGTGIVHSAPGFGEIDTEMGKHYNLTLMFSVDDEGKFIDKVTDFKGIYVKDADPIIINDLRNKGILFRSERIIHSYPYCYRCQTPLIQKAQKGWFIDIESNKKWLLKQDKKINWIPEKLRKRFLNTIKTAPDWNISRTRYWATVMPIWRCNKCNEIEVFGSIAEIEQRSGQKVSNLHRDGVDHIKFACKKCENGTMARIPEVLDVWFESGSMPYGQIHYPFENKDLFKKTFPADYIVEYIAQIRAWFYYMHVVANLMQKENSFKNVVVTGVLWGNDGRKMSKSYGNYPDPKETLIKYGGDALRAYFFSSPIMYGEDMNFNENDLKDQVKTIIFPLYNSLKYFVTYANLHNFKPISVENEPQSCNQLDKWLIARFKKFHHSFDNHLEKYEINFAVREIAPFINDLSTWYIRRSRERFVKGDINALESLYYVLVQTAKTVAPAIPFIAESIYQVLVRDQFDDALESVHFCDWPLISKVSSEDDLLLKRTEKIRKIASLGQSARIESKIKIKQPLKTFFVNEKLSKDEEEILKSELNVKEVIFKEKIEKSKNVILKTEKEISVGLLVEISKELKKEGLTREFIRALQNERKKQGFKMSDKVKLYFETKNSDMMDVIKSNIKLIKKSANLSEIVGVKVDNGTEIPNLKVKIRFEK